MANNRWLFMGVWVALVMATLVAGSWYLERQRVQHLPLDIVQVNGRAVAQLVQAIRLWNAQHGGVYVPVTDKAPPNPYLDLPDREVTDSQGRTLTKINPAYMTRQLSEILQQQGGVQVRLVSLKAINPLNRPDPWEQEWLQRFDEGLREDQVDKGESSYRYIRPLLVQPACLSCHAAQGYQVGDVRGAMSVQFPIAYIDSVTHRIVVESNLRHLVVFLVLTLLGTGLYVVVAYFSRRLIASNEEKRLLERKSRTDSLTGVLNHEAIWEQAEHEFRRTRQQRRPMAVLMLDLDHFKIVNDSYGHLTGDTVLKRAVEQIRQHLRENDYLGRYGGEEFLLLLPDTGTQTAMQIAERIRQQIERTTLMLDLESSDVIELSVTVSIGVAERESAGCTTVSMLIDCADRAMYQAKQKGRNQVVEYRELAADGSSAAG